MGKSLRQLQRFSVPSLDRLLRNNSNSPQYATFPTHSLLRETRRPSGCSLLTERFRRFGHKIRTLHSRPSRNSGRVVWLAEKRATTLQNRHLRQRPSNLNCRPAMLREMAWWLALEVCCTFASCSRIPQASCAFLKLLCRAHQECGFCRSPGLLCLPAGLRWHN